MQDSVTQVVTVPAKSVQSDKPILSTDVEHEDYVPTYSWEKMKSSFITKRQWICAEAYLKTQNYSACIRALEAETGHSVTSETVKKWLEEESVKEYLRQAFEERGMASGWTKERWLKFMTDHFQGVRVLKGTDLYALKLVASVKGYNEDEAMQVINQINFTQADGRP